MVRTEDQVKEECIKQLEKLIQEIKNDTTSTNYCFNSEILNITNTPFCKVVDVKYSITMTEYVSV